MARCDRLVGSLSGKVFATAPVKLRELSALHWGLPVSTILFRVRNVHVLIMTTPINSVISGSRLEGWDDKRNDLWIDSSGRTDMFI